MISSFLFYFMAEQTSVGVSAVAVGSDGNVGFAVFVNQTVQVRLVPASRRSAIWKCLGPTTPHFGLVIDVRTLTYTIIYIFVCYLHLKSIYIARKL